MLTEALARHPGNVLNSSVLGRSPRPPMGPVRYHATNVSGEGELAWGKTGTRIGTFVTVSLESARESHVVDGCEPGVGYPVGRRRQPFDPLDARTSRPARHRGERTCELRTRVNSQMTRLLLPRDRVSKTCKKTAQNSAANKDLDLSHPYFKKRTVLD
jgi:hypothetical protein